MVYSVERIQEIEQMAKHRRGKNFFLSYQNGDRLTRGQSILAKCYECNGMGEIKDCDNVECPLFPFHRGKEIIERLRA